MSHNFLAGGGSLLSVDGWQPIRVVVAKGWDACGQFLKTTMEFVTSINSFTNNFSVICDALW